MHEGCPLVAGNGYHEKPPRHSGAYKTQEVPTVSDEKSEIADGGLAFVGTEKQKQILGNFP